MPLIAKMRQLLLVYLTLRGYAAARKGWHAARQGRYREALSAYSNALKHVRQAQSLLPPPHDSRAAYLILDILGDAKGLCIQVGDSDRAIQYADEALAISRSLNSPSATMVCLADNSHVYLAAGRYEIGVSMIEEALRLARQYSNPVNVATLLANAGVTYMQVGQVDKALSYLEEAIASYDADTVDIHAAAASTSMAQVYFSVADYERCLDCYKRALQIATRRGLFDKTKMILDEMAYVCIRNEAWDHARQFIEQSRSVVLPDELNEQADALEVELLLALNQPTDALRIIEKRTARPPRRTSALHDVQVGIALLMLGEICKASIILRQEVDETERERSKRVHRETFFSILDRVRPYEALVEALCKMAISKDKSCPEVAPDGDVSSAAFRYAEYMKARSFIEEVGRKASDQQRSLVPTELRDKEKDIQLRLATLEEHTKRNRQSNAALLRELDKVGREREQLVYLLKQKCPKYAELAYAEPFGHHSIPLESQELLIQYSVCKSATYAIILSADGIQDVVEIRCSKRDLEHLVTTYVSQDSEHPSDWFSPELGNQLLDLLVGKRILGLKNRELIVSPAGVLSLLPFEVLVTQCGRRHEDCRYLGVEWNISYTQSASAFKINRQRGPVSADRPFFGVGNPILDQTHDESSHAVRKASFSALARHSAWGRTRAAYKTGSPVSFQPLPETEDEVRQVADLFGTVPEPPQFC